MLRQGHGRRAGQPGRRRAGRGPPPAPLSPTHGGRGHPRLPGRSGGARHRGGPGRSLRPEPPVAPRRRRASSYGPVRRPSRPTWPDRPAGPDPGGEPVPPAPRSRRRSGGRRRAAPADPSSSPGRRHPGPPGARRRRRFRAGRPGGPRPAGFGARCPHVGRPLGRRAGTPLDRPLFGLTHTFPDAAALAEAPPATFAMPAVRRGAVQGLAAAVADGRLVIDPGADRAELRHQLLTLPGVGDWTADYIAMRALGDPDVFLATDLGVRRGFLATSGGVADPASISPPGRTVATLAGLRHGPPVGRPTAPVPPHHPVTSHSNLHTSSRAPWRKGRRMTAPSTMRHRAPVGPLHETVVATPYGNLLLRANDRALTHLLLPNAHLGRPGGSTATESPILDAAASQLDEYFAKNGTCSPCRSNRPARNSSARSGPRWPTSPTARRSATPSWRRGSVDPRPSGRSVRPTGRTPWPSCCPATG